jgi:non-ribosomal peptide synthetase component F
MQREPGIVAGDRLLAITTISFDLATPDMWLPLIAGAEIVLAPRSAAFDGVDIARRLTTSQITFMQATPATWRLLIEAGWNGTPGLTILCGGEALYSNPAVSRRRSASSANSSSAATASRPVISTAPSSTRNGSFPIRSRHRRTRACTAPAIWCGVIPTGAWSSLAAVTTK